ncbi:MAG: hypothetical protein LBT30_06805 [Clostridiales bacterium]|nr:hypothetical protein [Clostridiales bacterium]
MFGDIVGAPLAVSVIQLSKIGKIVDEQIQLLSGHYGNVVVDKYVIMPNHIHFILLLSGTSAAGEIGGRDIADVCGITGAASGAPTIGNIIRGFKAGVSRICNQSVWQRNYYEHIIRDANDYSEIWEYIDNNPSNWETDTENV